MRKHGETPISPMAIIPFGLMIFVALSLVITNYQVKYQANRAQELRVIEAQAESLRPHYSGKGVSCAQAESGILDYSQQAKEYCDRHNVSSEERRAIVRQLSQKLL